MDEFQKTTTRRDFLKDGLRAVLFGGIIFTSTFLGLRKYRDKNSSATCPVRLPCDSCWKLKYCEEPKAKDFQRKYSKLSAGSNDLN